MNNIEAANIISSYAINGCGYCHEGGKEVEEAFNMAELALMNWGVVFEWIPLEKIRPAVEGLVLILVDRSKYYNTFPTSDIMLAYYDILLGIFYDIKKDLSPNFSKIPTEIITHWLPIPKVPSKEEKTGGC